MKAHPLNKSGRRKIERAIRNGWVPGLPPREFFSRKRRRRNLQDMLALENIR